MSLIERIFATPELVAEPPVLIDVGAAGGVTPVWREIARFAIGVGFEPDARDASKLAAPQTPFKRWIYCAGLVAPSGGGEKPFFLTRSPHCSSLLKPQTDRLQDWAFADLFTVDRIGKVPAVTLSEALATNGLNRIDWLKCDTQGLDLSLFLSLPEEIRRRMLVVEFEPGIIDAYEGEDKLWRTLQAMEGEPFWLCDLQVGDTPRGNVGLLREELGGWIDRWLYRLGPGAPAYVNVRYLRSVSPSAPRLGRRELLLAWVFANVLSQHAHALMIARTGVEQHGPELFSEMRSISRGRLRCAMLKKFPRWLARRLGLPA